MAQTRYTITTKGSRTVIRRRGGRRGVSVPARGTSSPPFEEIKHLLERHPDAVAKSRARKKRSM
jgi:hypothetical protein